LLLCRCVHVPLLSGIVGQTQTVFLPPWVPSTEAEKTNEEDFREAILKLSSTAANLIAPHPLYEDPDFCFDWVEHRPFAEAAYRGDKRLHKLLPRLVPKRTSEEEFWRNYFSHVFAVKRRFELGTDPVAPPTAATVADASAAGPSSNAFEAHTPATPASPGRMGMTISYPEKFQLALKYATEGPPLPNLSDADRILLEALQQQATIGECNRPRPGMWDSAEEKAKYEAWKKLGAMPRAEAMHLYVQAIEVFDERWMDWKGLQDELAAALGALTPQAANGGRNGEAKLDVAMTLGSIRALRHSLDRLPPMQQQSVRDECDALKHALDGLCVPPATR